MSRLTRQVLDKLAKESLHQSRNVTKADVYRIEWEGQDLVVKDIAKRGLLGRLTIAGWLLKREIKALEFLTIKNQLEGVPKLVAVGPNFFAMEFSSGTQLKVIKPDELKPEILVLLEEIIEKFHALGVAHGDLHRENVIVGENGEVSVIDWATASVFGRNSALLGAKRSGLKSVAWREWRALDSRGLAKIKSRYAPQLLTDDEVWILENGGSPLYRRVRETGFRLRRLFGNKKSQSMQKGVKRYSKMAKRRDEMP
jgi:predicted Ser/Thr protein kinase